VLLRRRDPPRIEELAMVLDSVHVDTDAMVVDLGWRGVASTPDEKASDLTHCTIVTEALRDAPAPGADLIAAFERASEDC
jgi:hypothetical protein